ncbi:TPA: ISLre2 family transposase [Acinetobacter baumannii]|nr:MULTISPECIES: ISLre2 family transposase [Bacillaceae]VIU28489.1 Uncharacterised protein family (UPF0236) [Streptococcus pneumoniae]HAV5825659.1 ISLre2 family transposase [Acinetobacter baumannii]HCC3140658.1 ISLre2 family transposase [Legionella pneumophila]MCF2650909.1 ISLre2 family transposase [Niallia circulans]MCM3365087.1 ISLre2 family transposase [Niallia sp. MER TA 168]
MKQNTIKLPTLKEIESDLFKTLQETFSEVLEELLTGYDREIAEQRDKGRYQLKDKRAIQMDTLFGSVSIKRNYYWDRIGNKYVYLLDQYLQFEGGKGFSPVVEEMAMELAVTGPSYRHASSTLEKLLGYSVASHEAIRQHLLQTEVVPSLPIEPKRKVLFIEVDGLFIKRQGGKKRGREEKIAAIHEGWSMNGKRASLVGKRHFIHKAEAPFWEELEQFLMDTYHYDPTTHLLAINGDGASWITACREYFQKKAFFTIDRFHVAREIQRIFKEHPRYKAIRKKLAKYDGEGLLVELNSAVATLDTEKKEERLEALINQLSPYPEALGDYRIWLQEQGIDTSDMRPMGSAEGTMSVFAKRLKNGRAWSEKGIDAFIRFMVGLKDGLDIKTLIGTMTKRLEEKESNHIKPKYYREKLTKTAGQATRQNIAYLSQTTGKPLYHALKALQGF